MNAQLLVRIGLTPDQWRERVVDPCVLEALELERGLAADVALSLAQKDSTRAVEAYAELMRARSRHRRQWPERFQHEEA